MCIKLMPKNHLLKNDIYKRYSERSANWLKQVEDKKARQIQQTKTVKESEILLMQLSTFGLSVHPHKQETKTF